jgi:CubicO group peptidase (beta-lactamase class C family)
VVVDGGLVWWRGFGKRDLKAGGEVTHATRYRIGSITKTVTSLALMKLREDGKLSLEDPAVKYIPELAYVLYPTRDSPIITIRHLMTHTSGLPRLGNFDYAKLRTDPVSEREVTDALAGVKLNFVPGTASEYSNFAYALLGIIVGRASGQRYRDYVSHEIFTPLGMQAVWDFTAIPEAERPKGYERDGEGFKESHEWLMGASEGMGGIYASLDDMARYVGFEMTAWPPGARADAPPLSNASLREAQMILGMQPAGRRGTGAGWGILDLGPLGHGVWHNGATATFAASAVFLPHDGIGAIALTNCGQVNDALDALTGKSVGLLVKAVKEPPKKEEPPKPEPPKTEDPPKPADTPKPADSPKPADPSAKPADPPPKE